MNEPDKEAIAKYAMEHLGMTPEEFSQRVSTILSALNGLRLTAAGSAICAAMGHIFEATGTPLHSAVAIMIEVTQLIARGYDASIIVAPLDISGGDDDDEERPTIQ